LQSSKEEITTIPIRKTTRDRLKELGKMNETYSDFIDRLLNVYEKESKMHEIFSDKEKIDYELYKKMVSYKDEKIPPDYKISEEFAYELYKKMVSDIELLADKVGERIRLYEKEKK
jgi:hypothetical protein